MQPDAAPALLDMRRECIYPKSILHVLNACNTVTDDVTDDVNIEMQQRIED